MFLKIILVSVFVQFSLAEDLGNTLNAEPNLEAVFVIYRHGDRTPIRPYPTDPYNDSKLWPVGFGQLTNKGKEQEYELGQWLRSRYDGFLPLQYSEKDIYVRSTDVDRTLMSAEVNLAGLYPLNKKETWNLKVNWQPIPVHTIPELKDAVLAAKKPCPKYEDLKEQLSKDPVISDINKRNHDLYSYMTRNSGKHIKSLTELEFLYSTLTIEVQNNFTLPNWTQKIYPSKMKPLAEFAFTLPCYTKEMTKLKVGPLFHEIKEHIINATNVNITKPKFWMYSAHDTTIANVLRALDLFEPHCPPYTSLVLFELYTLNSTYYLNIFYKNSTTPQKMTLKGCDFNCPIQKYFELTDPITISLDDWGGACKNSYLPFDLLGNILLIVMIVTIFLICCVGITIMLAARRNSEQSMYLRLPDDETV